MSPRIGRTGGAAARAFGKGTAVRGPRGIPSVVSATATVGGLDLVWTNTDATAQTRIYNGATLLATANAAATTYSVTGLSGATAYTLTVKHYKDSVDSAGANFNSTTTSLASPNSLSISSTGVSFSAPNVLASITLNWANGDASAQTRIYSGATLVATANAAATSYSVTETLGASVSYTVYHYKNSIESPSNSSTSGTAASYGTLNLNTSCFFIFPTTWNASNNSITVVGGGGSGEPGETGPGNGGGGGGSGTTSTRTNVASGGGTTYALTVGSYGSPAGYGGSRDGGTSYFQSAPSGGTIWADGGYGASGASGGSGQYTGGNGGSDVYRQGGSGAGTGGNGTSGNNPNDPGNTPQGGSAGAGTGTGGAGGGFLNGWAGGSGESGQGYGSGGGGGASGYNQGASPGSGGWGAGGVISITWGA